MQRAEATRSVSVSAAGPVLLAPQDLLRVAGGSGLPRGGWQSASGLPRGGWQSASGLPRGGWQAEATSGLPRGGW